MASTKSAPTKGHAARFRSSTTRERAKRSGQKPLWNHQKKTVALDRRQARVYDASDPGTGKTRAHLHAFDQRRKKGGKCLLVLAPKSLLQSAWGNDLDEYFPHLTYTKAYAENRVEAFAEDVDVYITNIDAVKWLVKQPKKFFARFDSLIIDEITAYKHRTSARSKAIAKIKNFFDYRVGMSGTPNPNSVTELWHQAYILDDGKRLGRSFFQFRNATCDAVQIGPKAEHRKWNDKPGAELAVGKLVSDITIRHQFDECMDIPENHSYPQDYTLPKKVQQVYREMEDHAIIELENNRVTAVHAAVLRNKLLQIASGAVYSTDMSDPGDWKAYKAAQWTEIDNGRNELILDLIEQRQHSVTFFLWRHQREMLATEADKRGVTYEIIDGTTPVRRREAIVAAYQAGFYQTLFLHPRTGAHGLTLTKGTSSIWASPIYEADLLKQGLHRVYRGGQTKRTENIMVRAKNTVEGLVYSMLTDKSVRMNNLLDLLKETRHAKAA